MRKFLTCWALFAGLIVHAQTFSEVYHNANFMSSSGRSVFELDGGYLFFTVQRSLDSTVSALFSTRIDVDGNEMQTLEFARHRNSDPGVIDPVWANANGTYTGAVSSFGSDGLDSLFLYHFDAVGDTISTHFVSADVSQGVRDCVGTPDGGFLIGGFCTATADPFVGCACLRKVTAQGEELWRRTWPQYQYIYSIRPMSDGSYLLGGNRPNTFNPTCLIKVDGNGDQQWVRFIGGSSPGGGAHSKELPNGNYIIPSSWIPPDSVSLTLNAFASVYCFNPMGQQLWRKDLLYGKKASAVQAQYMENDEYFMVGGYEQFPNDPKIATTLWRMNADGDTLYSRKYWYYGGYEAVNVATYGINRTSDGGLIMIGAVRQSTTGEQPLLWSTWVLKLDEHGCLTPGCHTVGVADYEMALQSALVLAPNPAREQVQVTLQLPENYPLEGAVHAMLLDAQGKEVLQQSMSTNPGELRGMLEVGGLPTGLYYLHLRDGVKWLAGGKVVVTAP